MSIKSIIPNTLTLLNLLSGLIALLFVIQLEFEMAFYAVCLGIFFDFFDGFAARLLNVQSRLGLELDSLADMVTSGVVPGLVMFYLLLNSLGLDFQTYMNSDFNLVNKGVPLLGFLITLASGYRLAKFNIDERQTDSFIGLPTPANCLFIVSLPILIQEDSFLSSIEPISTTVVLVLLTIISSFLLNSEVHLFSLKIKTFSVRKYGLQIGYLLFSAFLIYFFYIKIVSFVIIFYVILSVINNFVNNSNKRSFSHE